MLALESAGRMVRKAKRMLHWKRWEHAGTHRHKLEPTGTDWNSCWFLSLLTVVMGVSCHSRKLHQGADPMPGLGVGRFEGRARRRGADGNLSLWVELCPPKRYAEAVTPRISVHDLIWR